MYPALLSFFVSYEVCPNVHCARKELLYSGAWRLLDRDTVPRAMNGVLRMTLVLLPYYNTGYVFFCGAGVVVQPVENKDNSYDRVLRCCQFCHVRHL